MRQDYVVYNGESHHKNAPFALSHPFLAKAHFLKNRYQEVPIYIIISFFNVQPTDDLAIGAL